MNYIVEYYVKGYDELVYRTFYTLESAIKFIKHNEYIIKYEIYKINKLKLDLNLISY